MATFNIPVPERGKTDKETIQILYDTVCRLRRELENFSHYIDSDNVTEINTNITTVKSEHGSTEIKGPLLLMFDLGGHIRRKEGLDTETGLFTDEWYDEAGNRTAYIDSDGKLIVNVGIFKGDIITEKDAYVGNSIYVGSPSAYANKGLYFFDSGTGTFNNIGMFLKEETDEDGIGIGVYSLYLSNEGNSINIYSTEQVSIGSDEAGASLLIDGFYGYFLLSTSSFMPSHILHDGSGDLWFEHAGSGDLWIQQSGEGVLKIESVDNISIGSTSGQTFAMGVWRIPSTFYIGTVNENNRVLKKSEIESMIPGSPSGASGTFETADGKTVTVSNGLITSIV